MQKQSNLRKAIGPGLLVACAAVGGSHLVWSTRAGADFGWSLIGLILLANLVKYPFFLFGQRYAAATGESLLAGYQRLGAAYVPIFLTINILTGTINIAGVAMFSGALLGAFGIGFASPAQLSVFLVILCALLLLLGHYRLLDGMAKWVILILTVSTLAAVFLAWSQGGGTPPEGFVSPSPWQLATLGFLITLMGWMPAPIDLSAWSSLWMFSRSKQTGHFATVRETTVDFHIGYLSTVVLAVLFLALGVLLMHGRGEGFSASGIQFSRQLVDLYASMIGEWSRYLILFAAFVTMFSTTLTCIDGYPRSLAACCSLIGGFSVERFRAWHIGWILLTCAAASAILLLFTGNLLQLLTFAAVVSFVTSPILAYINYRVMTSDHVPESEQIGLPLRLLSWFGIAFFIVMTLAYLTVQFIL